MLALEPLAVVVNLAEIDAVFQEVGEGTVGEGNATIEFGDLGAAPFRDNAPSIEVGDQLAEGSQFEVAAKNQADGLCLCLVDDEFLFLGVVAERDGAAGPFALAP